MNLNGSQIDVAFGKGGVTAFQRCPIKTCAVPFGPVIERPWKVWEWKVSEPAGANVPRSVHGPSGLGAVR